MISRVPSAPRLALALILDFGVVATIVSGADRIIRAAAHIRRFGLHDFLVLIGAVIVVYVVVTRRGPGATAGERLLKVSYRVHIRRPRRRRRRTRMRARPPRTGQAPAEDPREAASRRSPPSREPGAEVLDPSPSAPVPQAGQG